MLPKNLISAAASSSRVSSLKLAASAILFCALAVVAPTRAQTATQSADAVRSTTGVASRLTSPIVEGSRVTLQGAIHPLANKANDRGVLPDGTKLERMQIVLKRSDEQESSLKRLVNDLHSAGSASYHKWLTPEQFGKQFGPSDDDVAKLESWLQAQGFTITKLSPGRQVLEVSGTAGQLKNTFHAEMHQYSVAGLTRYANANAPDVPAALAPVFGGFVSLNNFRFKNHVRVLGKAQMNASTHEATPSWTIGNSSGNNLILSPADFAVQYDLPSNTKGDNQTVAIINESNINVELVNQYRSLFGLSVNPPQVIIDGNDPGVDGINSPFGPNNASVEAYLDVEVAGSVAPNAQIDLVIANDTAVDSGLTLAMEHAVFTNVAPVLSLSFGGCEAAQGSFNTFISALWEQAAAQGQTVLVSTGDSGSAGCDNGTQFAVGGQAVNGLASTPYNVAVGGTDFYYANGSSDFGTYWNLTPSNSTPVVSIKSHVPEQPWNNSQYGLNVYNYYAENQATTIAAGSGGASTLGVDNSSGTPTSPYPKPSWQTGVTGIPADNARDLPDLALFAANGANNTYYPICAADADCIPVSSGFVQISGVGGTSASTPAFAGIMALINQKYGAQGQANYVLYPLAKQYPTSFNDVTVGNIAVPCATVTVYTTNSNGNVTGTYPPKQCKSVSSPISVVDSTYISGTSTGATPEGELSVDGTNPAYAATTGYDLATGLGTVDASNLIANWGKITLAPSTTTLTPSATTFAHGTSITVSGGVTGTTTPTGDVSLITTSTEPNNQGEDFFTLDGSGSYKGGVNFLPGGSYNIYGYYAGNGVVGPSQSTPVAITVTPENSTTTLKAYDLLNSVTIASGSTVTYGSPNALSATASTSSGGSPTTAPTGSITFLDGSTTLATAALNANGNAGYSGAFAIGSHSITAAFSGDGSYNTSTSAATTFTVAKNTPTIVAPFVANADQNGNPVNGQVTYIVVQVENSQSTSGSALAPTGTISITGLPSGSTTTATLVPGVDPYNNSPQGTGYFTVPASASGNYSITVNYPGDSNYNSTSGSETITFDTGAGTIATTTTAVPSATTTSPTSNLAVAVTVTSSGGTAPTGVVGVYASQYLIGSATLTSASSNSSSAAVYLNSAALFQGSNQVSVQYYPTNGSSFKSSATVITLTNPLSDFAMVPVSTILSIPTAGTQTDAINLSSTNGFAGAVSLSCSASGGVTCSLSPATTTLASGGQGSTTLTVNTTAAIGSGTYNVLITGKNSAGTLVHTLGLTVVAPSFTLNGAAINISPAGGSGSSTITATSSGGFAGSVGLACAVTATPAGATNLPTCSLNPTSTSVTGTTAGTSTLTVNTTSTTTPGNYKVTVTGVSGSLTATTAISVVVVPPPTFTLTGTAVTITSPGATGTSTISATPANGFTGTVALSCAVTSAPTGASTADNPTCSAASASVTGTSASTASLTINTSSSTTTGAYTLTVTGTSGSLTATTVIAVTVTAIPPSFTLAGTAVTIASQGATGTSTITASPVAGFTGTVALTCSVTSAPSGALTADNPTCSAASASVTGAGAATATLTINTTAQTAKLEHPFSGPSQKSIFTAGGGVALGAILLFGVPFGRRRKQQLKSLRGLRMLSLAILFALAAGAVIGCGSGSSGSSTPPPSGGTTTGTYTLTVTGTSGSTTATTTITVTVN
jgi:trimeric autotransporter adhesin